MPKGWSDLAAVGAGEYEVEGDSRLVLRDLFLSCLERRAPDIWAEFAEARDCVQTLDLLATRYNLREPWIVWLGDDLPPGCDTRWASNAVDAEHATRQRAFTAYLAEVSAPAPPTWDPYYHSEAEFRASVEAYICAAREHSEGAGLVRPVQVRRLDRDIRALIDYQVLARDIDWIATEHYSFAEEAARAALRSISARLGIQLRK